MKTRLLGKTGMRVSEIGFGTWGIGGTSGGSVAYGRADDAESLRAIRRAIDLGVNFFDTSDFYGFGHSEELLGRALSNSRDRVVIASKVGFLDTKGTQDFSAAHIRNAIEGSLRRLRADHLDLYLLHNPSLHLLRGSPETTETLRMFQRNGLLRAWGVSLKAVEDGIPVISEFGPAAVEVNHNLLDQRALESGLIAECARRGVGIIARTPLAFGFLTGRYNAKTVFDESDQRRRWSGEQIERWVEGARMFVAAVGGRENQTPAQVALRFCLSNPAISSAIPGMMKVPEVEENAAASDMGPLSESDLAEISCIYRRNTFFVNRR